MGRISAKFVVFAVLVLIAGSVQCVSACTPVSNGHGQPQCHHHKQFPAKQDPSGCGQELVAANPAQAFTVGVAMPPAGAYALLSTAIVSHDAPVSAVYLPPDPQARLSVVLKI